MISLLRSLIVLALFSCLSYAALADSLKQNFDAVISSITDYDVLDAKATLVQLEALLPEIEKQPLNSQRSFYNHLARLHLLTGQVDLALEFSNAGISLSPISSFEVATYVHLMDTRIHSEIELGMIARAEKSNEDLHHYSKQKKSALGEMQAFIFRVYFHVRNNRWLEAIHYAKKAYKLASNLDEQVPEKERISLSALASYEMGRVYHRFDPNKALGFYREAYSLGMALNKYRDAAMALHRLSIAALDGELFGKAENAIKELRALASKYQMDMPLFSSYTSASRLHLSLNELNESKIQLDLAEDMLDKVHSVELMSHFYIQKARLLMALGEFSQAQNLLLNHAEYFPTIRHSPVTLRYLSLAGEASARVGDNENAIAYGEKHLKLFKRIENEERSAKLEVLKIGFESDKKRLAKDLASKENLINGRESIKAAWSREVQVILIFALILLVLSFLIFNIRRRLAASNTKNQI